MLDDRLTEQRNARSANIDRLSALEIVRIINEEDRTVADAVAHEAEPIAKAVELAVAAFRRGARVLLLERCPGLERLRPALPAEVVRPPLEHRPAQRPRARLARRLGVLDAAEMPPTYGTDPDMVQGVIAGGFQALVRSQEGAEDDPRDGAAAMDERGVGEADFVIGIASSGTTPFVHGALTRARELGAHTGLLLCTPPSESMRAGHDVVIAPLTGPEVITGSTRMKAGTATKMVLNAITTSAMVRTGKVYDNLMVDLQASCRKLQDRGERILMVTCGLDRVAACDLLKRAGGHVKTALVMQTRQIGAQQARAALESVNGRIRDLIVAEAPDD